MDGSLENDSSGVGVIDKAALVMSALESGPATLAQLVSTTHLARPTAHRIEDHLLSAAGPVLTALRDKTHESAQLYRRQGDVRICVANAERPIGLRDSIPVGATMSMQGGSAAQVLLAWEEPDRLHRGLVGARFTATMLSAVRRRGWAQSVGEREPGVASVSAPVRGPGGRVVAAMSISGPIERMGRQPGRAHGHVVMAAARRLSEVLSDTGAA